MVTGLAGCGGTPVAPPPPPPTITGVSLAGITDPAVAGQTVQLEATATFSDGTTQKVTSQASWTSSSDAVATVSSTGMVTFVSAGEVDLRATYRATTGTTHVTVVPIIVRYALDGVVSDAANKRGVQNARVEILDGPNAGRSTQTDGTGAYRIADIAAGRITIRVTHPSFETSERSVTLSADTRLDIAIRARVDVTGFYGTFNVKFTIAEQTCQFPITPGPNGQLILSGRPDGGNFQAKIVERGTSRTYAGVMQSDGRFTGNASGLLPGFGPVILKHDFTGSLEGRVSGGSVTATEKIVYAAPCPGKIAKFNLSGNR
jgi:hypothetical protein